MPWFFSLLFWGCAPEEAPACPRDPPLSYDNFGQGFLRRHCAGCHSSLLPQEQRNGAPISINLDSYADAKIWADRIAATALGDAPTMPPGGGPTDDEKALLEEWLDCEFEAELP